jgi:hypothetical protein
MALGSDAALETAHPMADDIAETMTRRSPADGAARPLLASLSGLGLRLRCP